MLPRGAFGTDQQKEEPHRPTVERFEVDSARMTAAYQREALDGSDFGVGNGNTMPDAGRQDLFAVQHSIEQRSWIDPGPLGQQIDQLAKDAGLIAGDQGHPNAIWGEQFGEQQSGIRHSSGNANRPAKVGQLFGRLEVTDYRRYLPPMSTSILDQTPEAAAELLSGWAAERKLPAYRARQLLPRLWERPIGSWQEATDLPAPLRTELDRDFPLRRLPQETVQHSADGTRKYLWKLDDGELIESVLIPSGTRRTLCISSQAGCALGCVFCATGRMGFRRNLTAFEIAGQIRELVLADPADKPTNIVFMGMGEPLLNWPAVDTALTILNSPLGLGIGARHITVSTVGIIPGMKELAARPEQFRLAISLHAPSSRRRLELMPIEKKYHLDEVLEAARAFKKRITFEYVLIAGKNDSDEDADELVGLARRMGALVNLLPLHPGGAPGLTPTAPLAIRDFAARLKDRGVEAVVRRSRGLDISAACGQLRVETERKRRGSHVFPSNRYHGPKLST